MGIWAVGNFGLTGSQEGDTTDFIFDSRDMIVEVLPLDSQPTKGSTKSPCTPKQLETAGLLMVTSLQRLRNPLVRYLTGDVGSIHKLLASATLQIEGDSKVLRVLTLHGRDARRSFKWEGECIELSGLRNVMSNPRGGVLRWQVVLKNELLIRIPRFSKYECRGERLWRVWYCRMI